MIHEKKDFAEGFKILVVTDLKIILFCWTIKIILLES